MIAISRILCPTDFSEPSQNALAHADSLARWYGAEIVVLYVSPVAAMPVTELAYLPATPLLTPEARERLHQDLRRLVEPLRRDGVSVSVEVAEGSAATQIVARAEELRVDLIVVGTHGRRGLEHLMMGSVTESVLRRSPCPVLTVSRPARRAATTLFGTIVCPLDFSPSSAHTAHDAAALAAEVEGDLVLLHVLERSAYPPSWMPPRFDAALYRRDVEADAQARLRRALPPGVACPVDTRVVWGTAAREILRAVRERQAGLIVMGAHGGALDSTWFGSTAHEVVREAPCPVLVLRATARGFDEKAPEAVGVLTGVE
jgi:nucleotide-binding universal stress UspA family protein